MLSVVGCAPTEHICLGSRVQSSVRVLGLREKNLFVDSSA